MLGLIVLRRRLADRLQLVYSVEVLTNNRDPSRNLVDPVFFLNWDNTSSTKLRNSGRAAGQCDQSNSTSKVSEENQAAFCPHLASDALFPTFPASCKRRHVGGFGLTGCASSTIATGPTAKSQTAIPAIGHQISMCQSPYGFSHVTCQ
jgi:hypothetical protein